MAAISQADWWKVTWSIKLWFQIPLMAVSEEVGNLFMYPRQAFIKKVNKLASCKTAGCQNSEKCKSDIHLKRHNSEMVEWVIHLKYYNMTFIWNLNHKLLLLLFIEFYENSLVCIRKIFVEIFIDFMKNIYR